MSGRTGGARSGTRRSGASPAPVIDCRIVANPLGLDPASLYGVARRYNARRSALFVSRVLGKHVPAAPAAVALAGELLAARVAGSDGSVGRVDLGDEAAARAALSRLRAQRPAGSDTTVVSFAETATALGHLVRDGLAAPVFLHTTRAELEAQPLLEVDEAHSHASWHRLYHRDPDALAGTGQVVLVDDELTTGRTVLGIIEAVHALHPRSRYVVATLLDWRDAGARESFVATARRLGARIDVVPLVAGEVDGALVDGAPPPEPALDVPPAPTAPARHHHMALPGPATARLGWDRRDQEALDGVAPGVAERLAGAGVGDRGPVLCVGTEELMYVPLRVAEHLAVIVSSPVRYQSTTRSPVVVADVDGYPVRHGLRFAHHDEPDRLSRLHNVSPATYGDVVVFVEGAARSDRLAPMVAALATVVPRVHVVHVEHGR